MKRIVFALSAALLLLPCSSLMAQQAPRRIDFTQVLHGVDGKPLQTPEIKPVPMTLGYVCVSALEAQLPDDRGMPGVEKFNLDLLAREIYGKKSAVLSVEEIAKIKDRVGKVWGPMIVGAAWPLLDPSVTPAK